MSYVRVTRGSVNARVLMLRLQQQQEQQWAERQSPWGQTTRWGNGSDDRQERRPRDPSVCKEWTLPPRAAARTLWAFTYLR